VFDSTLVVTGVWWSRLPPRQWCVASTHSVLLFGRLTSGVLVHTGIPVLLGDMIQLVTAEGENFVLSVQVCRPSSSSKQCYYVKLTFAYH
jgi:hypothetical protein